MQSPEGVMSMECATCAENLDHCHGTLVLHVDGFEECTEPGCTDLIELRHTLVIDCHEVHGRCECVVGVEETVLLRAS